MPGRMARSRAPSAICHRINMLDEKMRIFIDAQIERNIKTPAKNGLEALQALNWLLAARDPFLRRNLRGEPRWRLSRVRPSMSCKSSNMICPDACRSLSSAANSIGSRHNGLQHQQPRLCGPRICTIDSREDPSEQNHLGSVTPSAGSGDDQADRFAADVFVSPHREAPRPPDI